MAVRTEDKRDYQGERRGQSSCDRTASILEKRPWALGKAERTKLNKEDDAHGVDIYLPVDDRLLDMLGLEHDPRGIMIQVKSGINNENAFYKGIHRDRILNLWVGEHIFVVNGKENYSLMMASLVGQMVALGKLSGIVTEEVILGFLADDLGDMEAVEAYVTYKEDLIQEKWFGELLNEGKIGYEDQQYSDDWI